MNHFEEQYLSILKDILENGEREPNRTGIDTLATWGQNMQIDLSEGFPIITTRKTTLRIAFEETWFFLRGETDTNKLRDKNIRIWEGNTSREFLDKAGLGYLPEGHLGKGYSFQWRNFGGDYREFTDPATSVTTSDYARSVGGFDQVANLINGMQKDPQGRRHIITAWNPAQTHEMALPPCHLYQQYRVTSSGKLNSMFLMRSWDFLYGAPFNIMGYALLNHAFAKLLNLEPGKLIAVGNDVHLYENQIEIATEQVKRIPYALPQIVITKDLKTLDDVLNMEFSDITLLNYNAHPDFKNKPGMAV